MSAHGTTAQSQQIAPSLARLAAPAQVVKEVPNPPTAEAPERESEKSSADEKTRLTRLLLGGDDQHATAIERLLVDVVAQEVPLVGVLEKAKLELAQRLLPNINNPKGALQVAKVLREVVVTSNAITKRVEHLLGSLATLRSQRRLLEQHRGPHDK